MPEKALTSFIVYDAYRYFAGKRHKVGHAHNIYYQRIIL